MKLRMICEMIDEEPFQRSLDAMIDSRNWQANDDMRLVFADWLEEQGDRRALGYRWMGWNHKYPQEYRVHDSHNPDADHYIYLWYNDDAYGWFEFELDETATIDGEILENMENQHSNRHYGDVIEHFNHMYGAGAETYRVYSSRRAAEEELCVAIDEMYSSNLALKTPKTQKRSDDGPTSRADWYGDARL